jgi:predicted RNA-binding protein (TIGR00451 family)
MFILVESTKKLRYDEGMENAKEKVRAIADYQFGKGVGAKLFPESIEIQLSPRTGRIRYINLNGERLATLRPTDGLLSLSIKAAQTIANGIPEAKCFVTVQNDVSQYIAKGGDVFAVHVVKVDDAVGAKDEVIAIDENHQVLAVGRTQISASEIRSFKTGVAVKIRHGANES